MKSLLNSGLLMVTFFAGITAFAGVSLPQPGQTLVCSAAEEPAGDYSPSQMHITNIGGGYVIAEFNQEVVLKVSASSASQVSLNGTKSVDLTETLTASVTLNSDGNGTASMGIGGWNPQSTSYDLSGCKIQ